MLPHSKYTKIVDKSTAKSIFESLCSTYEGNQQVKEAKVNLFVHQSKLFKMKDDGNIETKVSNSLLSSLQVLNKSYTTPDQIKKILRSLLAKRSLKVTIIQEAKDLHKVSLENLIRSMKSREIVLIGDEPSKWSKSISLKSKGKEL